MDQLDDKPVFSPEVISGLAAEPGLRWFVNITHAQLAGLLSAIGEYAIRIGPPEDVIREWVPAGHGEAEAAGFTDVCQKAFQRLPPVDLSRDDHARQAQAELLDFFWRSTYGPSEIAADPPVFGTADCEWLLKHKYIRHHANIGTRRLIGLLRTLDAYSSRVHPVRRHRELTDAEIRLVAAHNVIVCFRDRPLTLKQFSVLIRAVLASLHEFRRRQSAGRGSEPA